MNLIDVLKTRNIDAEQKKGANTNEYCSPCPKCGGNDRFVFWPESNRWLCRHCKPEGGNLVGFYQHIDGLSELEALEQFFLCKGKSSKDAADAAKLAIKKQSGTTASRPAKQPRSAQTQPKKNYRVDSQLWLNKATILLEWAHKQLLANDKHLEWLKTERGLSLDTIKRHKLGWNESDLYRKRADWGLSEVKHKTTGKPKKLWIPGGLVIPGYNSSGELVRIKIRTNHEIKYILLSGSSMDAAFYGNADLKTFAIVESELDAILLQQTAGDLICPISTGSAAIKPDQATLDIIGGEPCLLMFDSDEAGIKAAVNTWLNSLKGAELWLIAAKYGKDCTEAHRNGVDLRQVVKAGLEREVLAVAPEPEPLAEKELSDTEQQGIILAAYEAQERAPGEELAALIGAMEAADGNKLEFNQALRKIKFFLARGSN
jgi:hypothetical protein